MTGKPHGGLQRWLKLLPLWSSDQSSEAVSSFGLLPMKYCPLDEDVTTSCGWKFAHTPAFTHLSHAGSSQTLDIDGKFMCVCFADELKEKLQDFVSETNSQRPGFIKMVRHAKQEGLIRSRVSGWRAATAPVVALFDAHVEFNVGW